MVLLDAVEAVVAAVQQEAKLLAEAVDVVAAQVLAVVRLCASLASLRPIALPWSRRSSHVRRWVKPSQSSPLSRVLDRPTQHRKVSEGGAIFFVLVPVPARPDCLAGAALLTLDGQSTGSINAATEHLYLWLHISVNVVRRVFIS
jgi:hypothetical protein